MVEKSTGGLAPNFVGFTSSTRTFSISSSDPINRGTHNLVVKGNSV